MDKNKKAVRDSYVQGQFEGFLRDILQDVLRCSGIYHYAPEQSMSAAIKMVEGGHFKEVELKFSLSKGDGKELKEKVHEARRKARASWKHKD